MIKNLLITYLFLITNVFAGLPPTTVKGQAEAVKTTTFNVEVPYSQATTTAAGTRLLEVGNNNILANGSFEHSTYDTGWTCSLGTKTKETTTVFKGKNSMKIVSAGAGTRCYIYSTTDAAKLKGQQGHATVRVNSTDSVLQVCALAGGTTSAFDTNCVTVPVTTTEAPWKTIVIPTIMDGTGNGVVIKSAETLTRTVFVDEVEYKHGLPVQAVNGARLIGEATYTSGTTFSTTSGTFVTVTSTSQVVSYSGVSAPTTTNAIGVTIPSMQQGTYVIEANGFTGGDGGGVNNALPIYSFGSSDIPTATTCGLVSSTGAASGLSSAAASGSLRCVYNATAGLTNKEFYLKLKTGASGTVNLGINPGAKISVWYFPPVSTIYTDFNKGFSENAGEVFPYAGTVCPAGTLAADGSTVSRATYAELFAKIGTAHGQGDGSTTFNLPDYRGRFLRGVDGTAGNDTDKASRTAMSTGGNTGNNVGSVQGDEFKSHNHGTGAFQGNDANGWGRRSASGFAYASGSGTQLTNDTSPTGGTETRPKNAYVNYCIRAYNKNITGSFEKIEKCANDYECTSEFTAYISTTGVVTNENIDWINGNCTLPTGTQRSCTYNTNLKDGVNPLSSPMNCTASAKTGTAYTSSAFVLAPTSTGFIFNSGYSTNGELQDIMVNCQKGTSDYKPKTAKVASSIGVPTVPGVTTQAIETFNFKFGSATNQPCNGTGLVNTNQCAYLSQIGSAVDYVRRDAQGVYTSVFKKTYSKVMCFIGQTSNNARLYYPYPQNVVECTNCNSIGWQYTNTAVSGNFDVAGGVQCQVSY